MQINHLLNQTLTLYSKSSYDAYGREVVGTGTSVQCRFQQTSKHRMGPNNSLIIIDGICYVPADTTVELDDKVTFDSVDYKVYSKYIPVDGAGDTHHIKLELIKWKAT